MKNQKVAFLFTLFLVASLYSSMNFMPLHMRAAIPTQPNMSKEFTQSAFLDESPYSVDGFYETLDNDEFYTPDGFFDDTLVYASGGAPNGSDWADSLHVDGTRWSADYVSGAEIAYYRAKYAIEGFDYAIYGHGMVSDNNISVYNTLTSEMVTIETLVADSSDSWYNGTYFGPIEAYENPILYLSLDPPAGAITIDYIEIQFYYMPMISPEDEPSWGKDAHYGTSFTNITGIEYYWKSADVGASDYGIETDGDVFTQWINCDDANDESVVYKYDVTLPTGLYYEVRGFECNSTANGYIALKNGANTVATIDIVGTSWQTLKGWIPDTTYSEIDNIQFALTDGSNSYAGGIVAISYDYLRIGPSTEMGWQHDGSTTLGVTAQGGGSISSDGDYLSLTSDADGSYFEFTTDITDTQAMIPALYYPFVTVCVSSDSIGNDIRFRTVNNDDSGNTFQSQMTITDSIMQYNIQVALGGSGKYLKTFQIYGYDSETLKIKYIKMYSIANFTVTQAASVDEYLAVFGGDLYCYGDGATYFKIQWDGVTSIPSDYNVWVLELHDTNPTAGNDYHFNFYDGSWHAQPYDQYNGSTLGATVTCFAFYFWSTNSLTSIKFIDNHTWWMADSETIILDMPSWELVDSEIIIFFLPIDQTLIDWWLVLLAFIMIPSSSIYLVKGGRSELSADKILVALLLFFIGWGIILGAIF